MHQPLRTMDYDVHTDVAVAYLGKKYDQARSAWLSEEEAVRARQEAIGMHVGARFSERCVHGVGRFRDGQHG